MHGIKRRLQLVEAVDWSTQHAVVNIKHCKQLAVRFFPQIQKLKATGKTGSRAVVKRAVKCLKKYRQM